MKELNLMKEKWRVTSNGVMIANYNTYILSFNEAKKYMQQEIEASD